MLSAKSTALVALAALGISCHNGPPPAIDPSVAACVPSGAVILAGINLTRLRASPLSRQLPHTITALLEPLREADSLLVASNGSDYLALARGAFRQAPPGATLLAPGLSAGGSPDWLRDAVARHHSGAAETPALLERAEPLAGAAEIWMVTAGSVTLPVSGNAGNLNRLLHGTEYATLSVRLTDSIALEVVGMCGNAESARHLEETVRAFVTLGAAASAGQPAMAGLLKRIRITGEGRAVHLNLSVEPADIEQLFRLF